MEFYRLFQMHAHRDEGKALQEKEARGLKILALTTSYPSDEADPSGIFIAKLLAAIRNRGHVVEVVAPTNGRFHGRRTLYGIETVRFGYFIPRSMERLTTGMGGIPESMARSPLARIQLVPMMARFLSTTLSEVKDCDIMYANWLGAGLIGAAVKAVTGKPLVVSFRGDDGYLARDRAVWRALTSWVMRNSDKVAPVSRELGDILISLGLPETKCQVPRFGVDVEMFHPGNREPGDEVRILYVGALIRKKGVADLLEALADQSFAHTRLVLVGDGVDAPEFMTLAESLGIKDRVDWKGVQPHEEVARVMRECDLLCLPSYTEGRPNVVVEAMASGLPVVTTPVGGIPDLVREGETALFHSPGDVAGLRDCLTTLTDKPFLRAEMGRNARNLVMENGLNWSTTALDFESIFSEAVHARQDAERTDAGQTEGHLRKLIGRIGGFVAPGLVSLGLLLVLFTLFEQEAMVLAAIMAANVACIGLLSRYRQRGGLASSLRLGSCYSVALLGCLLAIHGFFQDYLPGQDSMISEYFRVFLPSTAKSGRISVLSGATDEHGAASHSTSFVPASAPRSPVGPYESRLGPDSPGLDANSEIRYVHAIQGNGREPHSLPVEAAPEICSYMILADVKSAGVSRSAPFPSNVRKNRNLALPPVYGTRLMGGSENSPFTPLIMKQGVLDSHGEYPRSSGGMLPAGLLPHGFLVFRPHVTN